MKRIGIAIVIALALILAVVAAGAQSLASFTTVTGKVEVQNPGEQAWQAAAAGMDVPVRTTISTGFSSRATLQLGASTLMVRPLTRLRIDVLSTQDKVTRTYLSMPVGRIRADVKSTGGTKNDFSVHSAIATTSVRGTGFDTDGVSVYVYEGSVIFSSQSGISRIVHAGETGVSTGGDPPLAGSSQREINTAVNPYTGLDGLGGGLPGLGYGRIIVFWQ